MAFDKEEYLEGKFIDLRKFRFTEDYLESYIIPFEWAYRPDIICHFYYGDTSYQSLISFINRIDNSPEGYYAGRIIKLLKKEYMDSVWEN